MATRISITDDDEPPCNECGGETTWINGILHCPKCMENNPPCPNCGNTGLGYNGRFKCPVCLEEFET